MNRTDIINYLINRYGYKSYLEIGVANTAFNFDKIIVPDKTGVDPETGNIEFRMSSDEFFAQNKRTFDIIFIDGYHEAGQAYRDILNSIGALSNNWTVVVHDCNPTTEIMQATSPQDNGAWTGDVWKAFVRFRQMFRYYCTFVVDTDFGVGVIRKSAKELIPLDIKEPITYANFDKNRKEWLNLISTDKLEEML